MSSGSEVSLKHRNRISHASKNAVPKRFDARSNAHEVKRSVLSPDETVTVNQHGKNISLSVSNIALYIFTYIDFCIMDRHPDTVGNTSPHFEYEEGRRQSNAMANFYQLHVRNFARFIVKENNSRSLPTQEQKQIIDINVKCAKCVWYWHQRISGTRTRFGNFFNTSIIVSNIYCACVYFRLEIVST